MGCFFSGIGFNGSGRQEVHHPEQDAWYGMLCQSGAWVKIGL